MYYMKNCMDKSIIYHEEESQFCQVNDIKNVNYVEMYGAEHLLRAVCMKYELNEINVCRYASNIVQFCRYFWKRKRIAKVSLDIREVRRVLREKFHQKTIEFVICFVCVFSSVHVASCPIWRFQSVFSVDWGFVQCFEVLACHNPSIVNSFIAIKEPNQV